MYSTENTTVVIFHHKYGSPDDPNCCFSCHVSVSVQYFVSIYSIVLTTHVWGLGPFNSCSYGVIFLALGFWLFIAVYRVSVLPYGVWVLLSCVCMTAMLFLLTLALIVQIFQHLSSSLIECGWSTDFLFTTSKARMLPH